MGAVVRHYIYSGRCNILEITWDGVIDVEAMRANRIEVENLLNQKLELDKKYQRLKPELVSLLVDLENIESMRIDARSSLAEAGKIALHPAVERVLVISRNTSKLDLIPIAIVETFTKITLHFVTSREMALQTVLEDENEQLAKEPDTTLRVQENDWLI